MMAPASITERLRTVLIWLSPLALAAGLAYLGLQVVQKWDVVTVDSKYFWLAGKFWSEGADPYGPAYTEEMTAQFAVAQYACWCYSPHWFFISTFLSRFDPLTCSRLWSLANIPLLLAASAFNVAAFRDMKARATLFNAETPLAALLLSLPVPALFALHVGFTALSQGAARAIEFGQCSTLIYFGASILIFAAVKKRLFAGVIGLTLVMLKPQIGLVIAAALVFSAYGRKVFLGGAILSLLFALPAFLITPAFTILGEYVGGVTQYGALHANLPQWTTGLRHVVWAAGGADIGALPYLSLALICVFAAGAWGVFSKRALHSTDMIMLAIAAALFFETLHGNDFVLVGSLLLYCAALRTPAGVIAVLALLLIWRAGNLPNPPTLQGPGMLSYAGNFYLTFGAGVALSVFFYESFSRRPSGRRRTGP